MLLISFWQVLMFLIAFRSLKQAKNERELGLVYGKARLKPNYTKNPSLGELRSLCQINQVCKGWESEKESYIREFRNPLRNIRKLANCPRRNFASLAKLMNFATPCEIFATLWNLHVISDIFTLTPLDFYLKIFCVITYSLLVIS